MSPAGCLFDSVFRDERPVELAAAADQQRLEGAAHCHFVVDAELTELPQHLVVIFDQFVRGLQVERLHGERPSVQRASSAGANSLLILE